MGQGKKISLLLIGVLVLAAAGMAQNMVTVSEDVVSFPDMIVYNGKVVTMDDTSFGLNTPIGSTAQAMAIRGTQIVAIGNNDRLLKMAGPKTDKVDLKGRIVFP